MAEYDGMGPYSREAYETNLNLMDAEILPPSPDAAQGVPVIDPGPGYGPINIDPGPLSPPPTNSNPTYRVTVEESIYPTAKPDYSWLLWIAGAFAAYKFFGKR